MELGKYNLLKVVRKTDLGYMLSDGKQEILMHYKEAKEELSVGSEVQAYIYTDKEERLTGTMVTPKLFMEQPNFVEVVQSIMDVGVFVNNGTPKDLLVSKDYLPYDNQQWPILGDVLFCGLKLKRNALVAKPLNRFDIMSLYTGVKYAPLELVDAYVIRVAEKGLGLITKDLLYIFVPNTQLRGVYRLGEAVQVTITKMLEKEAYGTLNEKKELLMQDDKEIILDYLKAHNGIMRLTAKSSSEDVLKLFNMSRKAFKRAYGALYKEQIIDFDEEKTFLKL